MLALLRRAAALLSLLAAACTQAPLPPGYTSPSAQLCVFPRACYRKACSCQNGSLVGCRDFPGLNTTADGGTIVVQIADGGTVVVGDRPQPTDPGVICLTDMDVVQCLIPEEVCVAQGPLCYGTCVRKGQSCPPGNDGGMPDLLGAQPTRCLNQDDVCCGEQVVTPADAGTSGGDGAVIDAAPGG